ncbi:MAG TPA: hypothetical protein VMS17_13785 [Gemmataceae bacterium]|nr:hypothetical protein [Gemmataceae bacterium]
MHFKLRRRATLHILAAACLCALAATGAAAGEQPPAAAPSLDRLAAMSWPELEEIYRASAAGAIPVGYTAGRAIYCPCSRFAGVRSLATKAAWRGKVFDDDGCGLVNQWCGFRAIKARVSYGPSRLDGQASILMDYGQTSWVWADVRDEAREVAPGLYLGRMYRCRHGCPEFQTFFALQICPEQP